MFFEKTTLSIFNITYCVLLYWVFIAYHFLKKMDWIRNNAWVEAIKGDVNLMLIIKHQIVLDIFLIDANKYF